MLEPAVGLVLEGEIELRVLDEPVFPASVESAVRRVWDEENAKRARPYVDNPLLSFVGVSDSTVWGRFLRYRHYIAWRRDPSLFAGERVAAMGVSGLTLVDGCFAVGCRGPHMTAYAGWWELLPSGSIDADFLRAGGVIDFVAALKAELAQETGIDEPLIRGVSPYALVFDPNIETYDVVARIDAASTPALRERWARLDDDDEYSVIELVQPASMPDFLRTRRDRVIAASLAMIEDPVLRAAARL